MEIKQAKLLLNHVRGVSDDGQIRIGSDTSPASHLASPQVVVGTSAAISDSLKREVTPRFRDQVARIDRGRSWFDFEDKFQGLIGNIASKRPNWILAIAMHQAAQSFTARAARPGRRVQQWSQLDVRNRLTEPNRQLNLRLLGLKHEMNFRDFLPAYHTPNCEKNVGVMSVTICANRRDRKSVV